MTGDDTTMKTSTTPTSLRTSLTLGLAGLLAGALSVACDLPDKDLGVDPAGTTGNATTGDGPCIEGETKMEDCNSCTCEDGGWSCTEMDCGDGSGGSTSSGDECDPADLPMCGDCVCENGGWSCDDIGCDPTGGLECDPATEPDDGCNECICDMGEWACTEVACPASEPVAVCSGGEVVDPFTIQSVVVMGDELQLTVQYSGGCANHVFSACWDQAFDESEPVQTGVLISHEDDNDMCDALNPAVLTFDLTPIRNDWIDAYQQLSGTITLNVDGWGPVSYLF